MKTVVLCQKLVLYLGVEVWAAGLLLRKVLRMKWSPSRFLREGKWLKTVMMKLTVLDSQVAKEEVEEFGEAEEREAVIPVNKDEGKGVEVAVQEPVQKTEEREAVVPVNKDEGKGVEVAVQEPAQKTEE